MQGDFSRITFDQAARGFSAVLSQQGRVQLDSEINEQTAILLHYLRTLAADVLGPAAYPAGPDGKADGGFKVDFSGGVLKVSGGRMYVDGILCESAGTTEYWTQPDGHLDQQSDPALPAGAFLVYLRVWERLVTADEDPAIREVALGLHGPDTTVRTKVVWQICWLPLVAERGIPDRGTAVRFLSGLIAQAFKPGPLLTARAQQARGDSEPSDLSPDSGYRGLENQLYRVEVHRGGPAGTATFKWSRENGSVTLPVRSVAGATVELDTLGRDARLGLEVGDLVELVDDSCVYRGPDDTADRPSPRLHAVAEVDRTARRVVLDADPSTDPNRRAIGSDPGRHPALRRWDHRRPAPASDGGGTGTGTGGALLVQEDDWLPLEDGVEVRFTGSDDPAKPRKYRAGDHWLIPARVVTGDVEWPADADGRPQAREPHGISYHHAPLAVVEGVGDPVRQVVDLRIPFPRPN
ncbi:DUF4815 domain-containing protein [Kitasatospora sp. NBC_01560]|uniref:DUF6519 domain-containing protein n=1 Tax=Kitasatospora sp. NBC_01560 TaxID=2975965 RepID=UPI0038660286